MREAAEELLDKYLFEKAARERAESQVAELTDQNKKLQAVIRANDMERQMLEARVHQLEGYESDYLSVLEEMKLLREQEDLDRLNLEARLKVTVASNKNLISKINKSIRCEIKFREPKMKLHSV
jgi:cell division FtsZ-interacting protein ZapD